MPNEYPWPDPPARAQAVVRLQPGRDAFPGNIVRLSWAGEQFTGVEPAKGDILRRAPDDPAIFATPGLFDVQINGYWGRGFKDLDLGAEGIRDLCWSIALSGSTRFLPTITTDAPETMRAAMRMLDEACRSYPDVAAMVAGIHQEGPWISPLDGPRGAHPLEDVRTPDLAAFERLQAAAGGRIAMLTLAPEVDGALDMIRAVSGQGVVVCLGHHQAEGTRIRAAVEAGARGVTHLGNGCSPMLPRHPNILWEQAAEDRLYAGIIADGHHLPPATAKVFCRAKPRDRLVLVSDAISMAGAPPGRYQRRDGIAEMTPQGRYGYYDSPILIGAAVSLGRCLANLTSFLGEDETPATYAAHATQVPGQLMGLGDLYAPLGQPGTPATFVVWRWEPETPDLIPQQIVIRGRTVFDRQELPVVVPFGRTAPPLDQDAGAHADLSL
jgi:N-acetylglucosamine-6-phosphate deacetylase